MHILSMGEKSRPSKHGKSHLMLAFTEGSNANMLLKFLSEKLELFGTVLRGWKAVHVTLNFSGKRKVYTALT
jgi:hypothetical protein